MNKGTLGFFIASSLHRFIASRFSLLALILLVFGSSGALAQNSPGTTELATSAPSALMQASYLGRHDPASVLNLTVALKLRNTQQLHEFLRALRNPASPEYGHFLIPQQFDALYGPTANEISTVASYLKEQGLQVTGVSPDNKLIFVTARSDAVERAFGIQINDYEYEGRRVHVTANIPQFPSTIGNLVEAVLGPNNIARAHPALALPINAPLSPGSSTPIGYSPLQLATAYNWPSLTDASIGAGVTIAIASDDSPNVLQSDYTTFWNYYGLPDHTVTFTDVDGSPPDIARDDVEETSDIEHAGAMAPGAAIHVYDASIPTRTYLKIPNRSC